MADTFCEEQVAASAERVKGEETSAPFPGLLMVTAANAGPARIASMDEPTESLSNRFITAPLREDNFDSCPSDMASARLIGALTRAHIYCLMGKPNRSGRRSSLRVSSELYTQAENWSQLIRE